MSLKVTSPLNLLPVSGMLNIFPAPSLHLVKIEIEFCTVLNDFHSPLKVWDLKLSEFCYYPVSLKVIFSLPNLMLVSPQECLIHFQLHLENFEVSAVLYDFHSQVLCVFSQTFGLSQSLVTLCMGHDGGNYFTDTNNANKNGKP